MGLQPDARPHRRLGLVAAAAFAALWSFGVGGTLPVDSAIFLEFLPRSHQFLITVLSLDWAVAQVVANLVAWPLLGRLTCAEGQQPCPRSANMGWRYLVVMGGLTLLMFLARLLLFSMYESPKYLVGKDRDAEAVRVLFASPRLAPSTALIMAVWALIGLAYPFYNAFLSYIQASRGAQFGDGSTYVTYRNSLIISTLGVPGALIGGLLVEMPRVGRKGALSAFTLTGVFLYCSTTALDSSALLGWNCAFNFCSNVMYAVLYGYTPEVFPTHQRGTGNALAATCNRIFGIMAPIVAMFSNLQTAVLVCTSGALFILAGLLVLILPFESRGKEAL